MPNDAATSAAERAAEKAAERSERLGPSSTWPGAGDPVRYIEAVSQGLYDAMREDESVYVMGQDISAYGGAFKVTRGFKREFGGGRVLNTPISESGTIGIATGSAILGRRPVVEMQFADFVSCGFNQLVNVTAKLYYRMQRPVPLVIRLPAGGGVGAGPFHSQNMEAWFGHTPGLKIVAPAFPGDAYTLLREAVRDPNPVLYFEHKYLYRHSKEVIGAEVRDGCADRVSARARVVRAGEDVSIIAYGWMVHRALEAADAVVADGIDVEVLDLRVLAPLDVDAIVETAGKTSKVIVLHEATLTCGYGAEISALIAEHALERLDGPVRRIAYPDTPVPFKKTLDDASLPGVDDITTAIRELAHW